MIRSLNAMRGYTLKTREGRLGTVDDFLFDDWIWTVRYLVANTGTWLPGRLVLLSPDTFGEPDWKSGAFSVKLTKKEVEKSPTIDKDAPVDRQREKELANYYGWPMYWSSLTPTPLGIGQPAAESLLVRHERSGTAVTEAQSPGDPHLRSVKDIIGYTVAAIDGSIGKIYDLLGDSGDWTIRYAVIDTGNWLPGRKVMLDPQWIYPINWEDRAANVALTRAQISASPEFNPEEPVNRDYEQRLYDYYGRPVYWR